MASGSGLPAGVVVGAQAATSILVVHPGDRRRRDGGCEGEDHFHYEFSMFCFVAAPYLTLEMNVQSRVRHLLSGF